MVSGAQRRFRIDPLFPELPAGRPVSLQPASSCQPEMPALLLLMKASKSWLLFLPQLLDFNEAPTTPSHQQRTSGTHCACLWAPPISAASSSCAHQVTMTTEFQFFPSIYPWHVNALSRAARSQSIGAFCLVRAQLSVFPTLSLW